MFEALDCGIFAASLLLVARRRTPRTRRRCWRATRPRAAARRWDAVKTLHATGTLSAGGLSGDVRRSCRTSSTRPLGRSLQARPDRRRGRLRRHARLDARSGRRSRRARRARSEAPRAQPGLARRARATGIRSASRRRYGAVADREPTASAIASSKRRPTAAIRSTLWFDAASGTARAHRAARRRRTPRRPCSTTIATSAACACRSTSITDRTDAAGRTDPRSRTEMQARPTVDARTSRSPTPISRCPRWRRPRASTMRAASRAFRSISSTTTSTRTARSTASRRASSSIPAASNLLTPAAAKKFGITGEGKLAGRGVGDEAVDVAFAHAKRSARSAARCSPIRCS